MTRSFTIFLFAALLFGLAGCQSIGGIGDSIMGSDEPAQHAAMPSDTYDNCTARVVEGVNFLSTGTSSGGVRLGMSECQLVGVLGAPASVAPGAQPGARRFVTMTYANVDGTSTSYVFVDNALKEMNRATAGPPIALPDGAPPG